MEQNLEWSGQNLLQHQGKTFVVLLLEGRIIFVVVTFLPDEQTKHPFLVEFEPNDPMNPKVKMYKSLNNRVRLIYSTELVKALQMVYNSLRWDFGAQCVRFILKRA